MVTFGSAHLLLLLLQPDPPPIDLFLASESVERVCNCNPMPQGAASLKQFLVGSYKGWIGRPSSYTHYGTQTYAATYTAPAGKCAKNITFYAHSVDNGQEGPHDYTSTYFLAELSDCPTTGGGGEPD